MMNKLLVLFLTNFYIIFLGELSVKGEEVSDYIIMNDIGSYKFIIQTRDFITGQIKPIPGYAVRNAPGDLIAADHFHGDHNDTTYETYYINNNVEIAIKVQATKHAGSDSDQWLLHEIESSYRDGDKETLGLLTGHTILRNIDGKRVFYLGLGGGSFSWISDNIAIDISYTDLEGTKPEPIEVIQAYLQKFPSSIPETLVLDRAHDERWIKDEMNRRLWLCNKWLSYQQNSGVNMPEAMLEVVSHLEEFLNYREKYYNLNATPEKRALEEYMLLNNHAGITEKLSSYEQWWDENKGSPINLP